MRPERREPATAVLFTCEHGGRRVPAAWRPHFHGAERALASHRGWDPGALDAARNLARAFAAPLVAATTTRLLVDLNRSPHNPEVFSRHTRRLDGAQRARLIAEIHAPHWERVREALRALSGPGTTVLHVAVHSFTPVLAGVRRPFEVGLLYDPKRRGEADFSSRWQRLLRAAAPGLRVRRNAPYRGSADGLTTALRRELAARRYRGIELELSQGVLRAPARRRALLAAVRESLAEALGREPRDG